MHRPLHLRDDIDRLYVSRKEEATGLANIEDYVNASIQGFKDCVIKWTERRITAACNNIDKYKDKQNNKTSKKQKCKEKQLNEYF